METVRHIGRHVLKPVNLESTAKRRGPDHEKRIKRRGSVPSHLRGSGKGGSLLSGTLRTGGPVNSKAVKKLRKILNKNQFQMAQEFRESVRTLTFKERVKLAWKIVAGAL